MKKYQNILFLDFDGVLTSTQNRIRVSRQVKAGKEFNKDPNTGFPLDQEICLICLSNLTYIFENVSDLKVVISSDWRLGKSVDVFKIMFKNLSLDADLVADITPKLEGEDLGRNDEIKAWLKNNPTKKYVIIDDSNHGFPSKNFILTDPDLGLTILDAKKVVKKFKL